MGRKIGGESVLMNKENIAKIVIAVVVIIVIILILGFF